MRAPHATHEIDDRPPDKRPASKPPVGVQQTEEETRISADMIPSASRRILLLMDRDTGYWSRVEV